ncbi:hypothetical protein FNV43_RR19786 [Rhamnella rubrinervis]|uniref:Uncharacterized protein n=1 Tax=Rhamnella rubrinervis TaxID=2594499 RepID=A0A8K0DXH2_9ROSA|nr:hypothetical protein FNV43_RR19786 [Rhamnella rubrinervis]
MQAGPLLSLSPSFNSYSSTGKLAEIAARVVKELRQENINGCVYDSWEADHEDSAATQFEESTLKSNPHEESRPEVGDDDDPHGDEDGEFEFAFVCREQSSSPISADEIFYNGQIKPIYPLFDRDLLLGNDAPRNDVVSRDSKTAPTTTTTTTTRRRQPLRKLMFEEERESTASCSSSEADELDGLPPETFCVWTPKTSAEASPQRSCKKSNSTGSSKRWKFRRLLSRSNSEGKDMFVFLTPSKKTEKGGSGNVKVAGKSTPAKDAGDGVGAHKAHAHYVKNKEDDKKKSLLPLVGFLGKNLHPF